MNNQLKTNRARKSCPCVAKPFEECYCNHMNSQKVEDTLKYCNNDFKSCEIFRARAGEIREMYPSLTDSLVFES